MQYIFLVETTQKCKSDELYIKSFINNFYSYPGDKLTFEYMNGKTNFDRFDNKIQTDINKYKGKTVVFICYDIDNPKDATVYAKNKKINEEIENYAKKNNYETIWFNPDIENVFIGKNVSNDLKKKTAENFYKKDFVKCIKNSSLNNNSNIKITLDKYLILKVEME